MTQKRDHIVRNTFRDLMEEALNSEEFRKKFKAIFNTSNPSLFSTVSYNKKDQRIMADYFARVARELRLCAGEAK